MPWADKERHNKYARERAARLRAEWFSDKKCAFCGSTDHLELDHIDPEGKVGHCVWSWSPTRRAAELAKCRPLCKACHRERSAAQCRKPVVHGRHTTYCARKCRCDLCRRAHTEHTREWRARKKAAKPNPTD